MTDHQGGGPIRLIRTGLYLVVGPRDDLALHDGSAVLVELGEEGEGVGPHQLPHQGQRQGLVPVLDVRACKPQVSQGLLFIMPNLLLQLLRFLQLLLLFSIPFLVMFLVLLNLLPTINSHQDKVELLSEFHCIVAVTKNLKIYGN